MTNAYSDLGGAPETYEQARARSIVLRPSQALTEQELAARLVEGRERMKMHDRVFAADYLSIGDERIISRALAKRLGVFVNEPGDGQTVGNDD